MTETRGIDRKKRPARRVSQPGRPARAAADTDPAHIDARIGRYWARGAPAHVQAEVTAFARLVVAQAGPASVLAAGRFLSHVAGLAGWALRVGMPLETGHLLHPDTIERYAASIRCRGARNARTALRRVGESVNPQAFPPSPAPLGGAGVDLPYSDAEIAGYLALAATQPTLLRRMRLTAIICLSAGAGVTAPEMLPLQATDLQLLDTGALVVQIRGRYSRAIPVSPRFRDPLLTVVVWADGGRIFSSDSLTVIRNTTAQLVGGGDLPRVNLRRLRNTWLAAHLRAIGFAELLAAAGLRSSETIFALAALEPQPTAEQIINTLSGRRQCA